MKKLVYLLTILTLCVACAPTPKDVQQSDQLPPIYPDYCEVTIPENIAPLNFLLRANCEAIEVKAGVSPSMPVVTKPSLTSTTGRR